MDNYFSFLSPFYDKILTIYDQYEKYVPIASFFTGFSWDSITLTRIDRIFDNVTLLTYILLLGGFISLTNLVEKQVIKKPFLVKYREWYPIIIQFFLGGLFSAYLIFYFQSADLTKNWLFIGLLLGLLVANEFLSDRLTNIYLQMLLYFLACFSFFIFFMPVVTGYLNVWMFLLGGFISLAVVIGTLYMLYHFHAVNSVEEFWRVTALVGVLFGVLNLFYFMNWIPPIPLSLKFGGMYHQVTKVEEGYALKHETPEWYQFFKDSDDEFFYAPGDTVFCFTSVFAPTTIKTKIYHRWQKYLDDKENWETTDRISYPISGGRDGGYRSYTYKRYIKPGEWRIRVETENEQVLGQIYFDVKEVAEREKELVTIVK